jgi:iron(III) transport system permease protein
MTAGNHTVGIAPTPRLIFGVESGRLIQWAVFLVTLQVVLAPLLPIIYQSFIDRPLYDAGHQWTAMSYARLAESGEFWQAMGNSVLFAVLATIFSQVVGAVLAILLGRTDMPGRGILGDMVLWPLILSALVLGFGWFMAYGPAGFVTQVLQGWLGFQPWSLYSITGMSIVAGTTHVPLAVLYCLSSVALSNNSLEDASRVCGARPMRTLFSVTLPLLTPAILYSGLLNFTATLSTLSIPLIFGEPANIPFFTTFLHKTGLHTATPDYGLVSTAAMLFLALMCGLIYLQNRFLGNTKRFVTVGGKATRPKTFELGAMRWPAFLLVLFYVVFFILLPIGTLFLRAFVSFLTPFLPFWSVLTFENFQQVFELPNMRRSIVNTIFVSLAGAAIGTGFIFLIAAVVHRSRFRLQGALDYIAMIPRALPGIIAGIGFFYAAVFFPPIGLLRNSIWILVVAYIVNIIPTGYGALSPTMLQIGSDLDRSARVNGAGWWKAITTIILPLSKPAMFTCFALLFINFFKEYTIAVFLVAPGSEVIGTTLLQVWQQGVMGQVAALSAIQVLLTIGFVFVARKTLGIKIYG